jgi:hypothetical protein
VALYEWSLVLEARVPARPDCFKRLSAVNTDGGKSIQEQRERAAFKHCGETGLKLGAGVGINGRWTGGGGECDPFLVPHGLPQAMVMAATLLALHHEGGDNELSLLDCEEDLVGSCNDTLPRVASRGLKSWFRLVNCRRGTEHV